MSPPAGGDDQAAFYAAAAAAFTAFGYLVHAVEAWFTARAAEKRADRRRKSRK